MTSAYGFPYDPRMAMYQKKITVFYVWLPRMASRMAFTYGPLLAPHPPTHLSSPPTLSSRWIAKFGNPAPLPLALVIDSLAPTPALPRLSWWHYTHIHLYCAWLRVWPPRMTPRMASAYGLHVWLRG